MILGLIAQLIGIINDFFRRKKCLTEGGMSIETFSYKNKKYDKEKYIKLRKESYLNLKPRQLLDEMNYFNKLAKKGKMDGYSDAVLRSAIRAYNAKPSTEKIDEDKYISELSSTSHSDNSYIEHNNQTTNHIAATPEITHTMQNIVELEPNEAVQDVVEPISTESRPKTVTINFSKKSLIVAVSVLLAIATACAITFFVTKEIVSKSSYKNGYDTAQLDANEQYEKGCKDGYAEGRGVGYNIGYADGSKDGERIANEKAKDTALSRQTITLTPGVYKVGTDIAEGRYKLVAVSGHGYVFSPGSSLSATLGVDSDYAQKEYTATLNSETNLVIDDVTIKLLPV